MLRDVHSTILLHVYINACIVEVGVQHTWNKLLLATQQYAFIVRRYSSAILECTQQILLEGIRIRVEAIKTVIYSPVMEIRYTTFDDHMGLIMHAIVEVEVYEIFFCKRQPLRHLRYEQTGCR